MGNKSFKSWLTLLLIYFSTATSWGLEVYQDSIEITEEMELNFLMSASRGDVGAMVEYLDKGGDINVVTDEGVSALMAACIQDRADICKFLIAKGANLDLVQQNGLSALMLALQSKNSNIAILLLKNNANINIENEFGHTPLMLAVIGNDTSIINILLTKGVDKNTRDFEGLNAFILSIVYNNKPMIEFLLQKGFDINSCDIRGITALMISSGKNDVSLSKYLISKGADVNALSKAKQSALSIAIQNQHTQMVNLLIENGANTSQCLSRTETPLTVAYYFNANDSIISVLKANNASQNALPLFKRVSIGFENTFNNTDLMAGINIGIKEIKTDMDFSLGINFTVFPTRTIFEKNNNYYQFWESRNVSYLSIIKNFEFKSENKNNKKGVYIGLRPIYTISSYKSASFKPENTISVQPDLGFYFNMKSLQFNVGYSYLQLNAYKLMPHRLSMGIKFYPASARMFDTKYYKKWDDYGKD